LWILIPIIFFSFSVSKLPGYILPIFPALALVIGQEVGKDKPGWPSWATATILVFAALAFGWRGGDELGISHRAAWTIAVIVMLLSAIALALKFLRGARAAAIFVQFGLGALVIAAAHLVFPGLAARESIRELAEFARKEARPGERLVFFLNTNQGINFYATSLPLRDKHAEPLTLQNEDEFPALLAERGMNSLLVMSYERWSGGIVRSERLRSDLLARHSLGIRCSPGCDWVLLRVALR
jgi:4-amino-4-deoxy-L-arabinose transferase-like glycosyltransferase